MLSPDFVKISSRDDWQVFAHAVGHVNDDDILVCMAVCLVTFW